VHGRTREDHFEGTAEYDTVAEIKAAVGIPVLANGDIASPEAATAVLRQTGVDGLMIGRAAQGRPWLFGQIAHFLSTGEHLPEPARASVGALLLEHLEALYALYGDALGVRVARKHIQWYCREHSGAEAFWIRVRSLESPAEQRRAVEAFFRVPEAVER
jgi:tRNA-dihydrouridine synthase B